MRLVTAGRSSNEVKYLKKDRKIDKQKRSEGREGWIMNEGDVEYTTKNNHSRHI